MLAIIFDADWVSLFAKQELDSLATAIRERGIDVEFCELKSQATIIANLGTAIDFCATRLLPLSIATPALAQRSSHRKQ